MTSAIGRPSSMYVAADNDRATSAKPSLVVRDYLRGHIPQIICGAILILMAANMISLNSKKSITNDEMVHIPAGYHYLKGGDFRQNPEHPPLIKMWAALPLLALNPTPSSFERPAGFDYGRFSIESAVTFWKTNKVRFETIVFVARLPMVLLTLMLGVAIYFLGSELFGVRAAVLGVAMFSLEPTVLAHGRIVHTDTAAALGYFLFFFALYRFLKLQSFRRAVWLGLSIGFALLTKFSMIILVAVFFLVLGYTLWRVWPSPERRLELLRQFATAVLCGLLLINAFYYFQHSALGRPEVKWIIHNYPVQGQRVHSAAQFLSIPFPTYYVFGFLAVASHNDIGHSTSLLGRYGNRGWWYYFPVAFALKTTIPFLLLSIVSVLWALKRGITEYDRRLLLLVLPVLLYMAIAMTSSLNIGVRHVLPVFPFLFLLGGALLDRLFSFNARAAVTVFVLLLGWMFVDAVRAYPHYMVYSSPLLGNTAGWQVLSDSNVEWGEDVGELARYLSQRGEKEILGALSAGWATLELYGVRMIDFAPREPGLADRPYVALGASHLNGSTNPGDLKDENGYQLSESERHNYFSKYRSMTPEVVFGKSIYLYRIRE
ncbi:MAG TPA: glycosyltransferase family 39 protein [Pyrinomonadaceae bacterium]|nr:glycosyltransferase family 39 protein [Pyrinomonadaceae bacterium]